MTHQKETPTTGQVAGANESKQQATSIIAEQAHERKRFTTLQARAALAGQTLTRTGDSFMLARWGYSKHVGDLDSVEKLIRRMGGK